jgi:flavodoxin
MRALVVYESMFGNTQKVAEAVTAGLRRSVETELVPVGRAPAPLAEPLDLLVVGGPTHAFSMTRERTREDAVRQGAEVLQVSTGLREWIARLTPVAPQALATFDTRAERARRLPGSAARAAAKQLRRLGYRTVVGPESFLVVDIAGPLVDGEVERAREWGQRLGQELAHPAGVG